MLLLQQLLRCGIRVTELGQITRGLGKGMLPRSVMGSVWSQQCIAQTRMADEPAICEHTKHALTHNVRRRNFTLLK